MSLPTLSLAPLLASPLQFVYGVLLALLIVYASVVPDTVRLFADTLLGRLFGILWIYLTVEGLGWLFGLFTAMAFLMIIYLSPRTSVGSSTEGFALPTGGLSQTTPFRGAEGFHGGVVEKERIGKRWFVERVLGENPVAISTEKVTTLPVQD